MRWRRRRRHKLHSKRKPAEELVLELEVRRLHPELEAVLVLGRPAVSEESAALA
jgi:hypothetical protein